MTEDGRRYRLRGDCESCGKLKMTFTGENWEFRQKSKKELAVARTKRQNATLNRKAKKLGLRILESDAETQKCVKNCLKEAK